VEPVNFETARSFFCLMFITVMSHFKPSQSTIDVLMRFSFVSYNYLGKMAFLSKKTSYIPNSFQLLYAAKNQVRKTDACGEFPSE